MLRAAAQAGDADMAALVATTDRERLVGTRGFVEHLAEAGHLRADRSVDVVTDGVWLLLGQDVAPRLVSERGWSWDDAEGWLGEQLAMTLLGRPLRPWGS
jgi:hypothetical protein